MARFLLLHAIKCSVSQLFRNFVMIQKISKFSYSFRYIVFPAALVIGALGYAIESKPINMCAILNMSNNMKCHDIANFDASNELIVFFFDSLIQTHFLANIRRLHHRSRPNAWNVWHPTTLWSGPLRSRSSDTRTFLIRICQKAWAERGKFSRIKQQRCVKSYANVLNM